MANTTCFVIMPYGEKTADGGTRVINFDHVYDAMIVPAVQGFHGLQCIRCDRIDEAGLVHKQMLNQIFDARVALVDISTLNANVFYELGVRHALCRSATVLIKEEGTPSPFNIAGLKTVSYSIATPEATADAVAKIRAYVDSALRNPTGTDSLVFEALPHLRVLRAQQPVANFTVTRFRLAAFAADDAQRRVIGFVTGDRRDIKVGDIWVNSENTNMQMDSFYGKSTSATIRYLGAEKDDFGDIKSDTIGEALRDRMTGRIAVPPAAVVPTTAGALQQSNGVKWVFHVAAVLGQPLQGYKPIDDVEQCVKSALRKASTPEFAAANLRSILFPIFGTGPGGKDVEGTIARCLPAAIEQFELGRDKPAGLREVYFYVWGESDLEVCRAVAGRNPALMPVTLHAG
jgi:O-acetyl-ADP-ribose deacetylase (regulator of RNase III)